MPEGQWPRGVTPRPRSGAAAKSTRLQWHRNGQEELPRIRGRGGSREEIPSVRGQGWRPGEATPRLHAQGQGRWWGGDTPRPKSDARGGGLEEIPNAPKPEARGYRRGELPHAPKPEAKGGGGEEHRMTEARGGGQEDQTHVQGAVAARAQEGLEELSHIEGQEGQW